MDEKQRYTFDIFVAFLTPVDTLTNSAMSATSNPRTQESVSKMVSLVGKKVVRFPNPLALGSK